MMNKFSKYVVVGGMLVALAFAAGCGDDKKAPANTAKPATTNTKPAATAAAFTQKNTAIKVPANVVEAFNKAAATDNVKDGSKWVLTTTKTPEQIQADMNKNGYFVYGFLADGPDNNKKFKDAKGADSREVHVRRINIKVCPHMVVSCKTEAYNSGLNKPGKTVYGDVIKEKDVKYAVRTKNGKRNCIHDGKDVAFDAKL